MENTNAIALVAHDIAILFVAFALAFLTESGTEYVFGTPLDHIEKLKPFKWLLMYIALGVGIALTLYYKVDIIAIIARVVDPSSELAEPTLVGFILSGTAVGRGANYLSDFVSKYLKPKPG